MRDWVDGCGKNADGAAGPRQGLAVKGFQPMPTPDPDVQAIIGPRARTEMPLSLSPDDGMFDHNSFQSNRPTIIAL
jgi:hypothetical protein